MIFGDKSRFAIEFIPIIGENHKVAECKFSYLVDQKQIGNLNFEASIDEILEELRG